ncbi:MAG: MBG domain-containing protein [Sediminibacterium sp.]
MQILLNKKSSICSTFSRHFLLLVFVALTSFVWGQTTTPPPPTTTTFISYMPINGVLGTTYTAAPSGSISGLTQFAAPTLPAGFSINATTGLITGSSQVALNSITPYTVTAKDATNTTITGSIMITITSSTSSPTTGTSTNPPTNPPAGITTFNYIYLIPVNVGVEISHKPLTSSVPTSTTSFALTTESKSVLDNIGGLSFDATTGIISGKVEKLGSYNLQVNALDVDKKIVATAYTFISITLPSFNYKYVGNIIVGLNYATKPDQIPTGAVSFELDASNLSILNSIGGLTFNTTTGVISGKPEKLGSYNLQVYGIDANGKRVAQAYLSIFVSLPRFEYVTSSSTGIGYIIIGTKYTAKVLSPVSGVVSYAIDDASASAFASIEGISLDAVTGTISGFGIKEGKYNIKINGLDVAGKIIANSQQFITVSHPWFFYGINGPAIIDSNLEYSIRTPLTKAKTYALDPSTEATFKNIGTLNFNTTTGVISGVPNKLGTYMFIVNAYDAYAKFVGNSYVSINVSLPIFEYDAPRVITVNKPISIKIKTKPANAKTFSILQNSLFDFEKIGGLQFNATTGEISGTPKNLGSFGLRIIAKDENNKEIGTSSFGSTVSLPKFLYTVNDSAAEVITVDIDFSTTIKKVPENAIRYDIESTSLSMFESIGGLSLNYTTGAISGKPQKMGTYFFNVNAFDVNSQAIASADIILRVTHPQFTYAPGSEKGVIGVDYVAKVQTPIANVTNYDIDDYFVNLLTEYGLVFNKKDGTVSGRPLKYGYVYVIVNAYDASAKQIGISYLRIYIKNASTISIVSSTNKFIYNNKAQGPNQVKKTGSPGEVSFRYKGVNNNYDSDQLPINAGDYSVVATVAEDANYFYANSVPFLFTIEKAPVSISAKEQLKAYGTSIGNIEKNQFTLTGTLVEGQAVTEVTLTPNAAAINAKTAAGSAYNITPSAAIGTGGFDAANYSITYLAYNGIVAKKKMSVTATGPNKLFGNPLTAEVSSINFLASGMLDGETVTSVTMIPDANGLSSSAVAGSAYKVTPSLAKGSGGFLESNYDITYVAYDGIVGKRELVITATGPIKVYGTALKVEFTKENISFKGLGSGETITEVLLTPNANGQLANLAAGEQYTITPSAGKGTLGDLSANYNITYVPFTGTVTKKSLTINATGPNKTYGTALTAGISSVNFKTTDLVGTEAINQLTLTPDSKGLSATTPAGSTYIVVPSAATGINGYNESNYDITYLPFNGIVAKGNTTVSIIGSSTYAYTGNPVGPSVTNLGTTGIVFTYTGIAPTIYASNTPPSQAGTYQVVAKLNVSDNLNETISSAFVFKIEKGNSTISVTGDQSFTYNGKLQGPATSSVLGSKGKVVYTYSGINPTVYTASTIAPKNAGRYQVVASVPADDNFNAASSEAYTFTITKANLKVTADDKSKTLNKPLPILTKFFTGFAQGDDSTSLSTQPVITTTASESSPLGTYPISVSGGSGDNYILSYQAGTLTVDLKLDPTINLSDAATAASAQSQGVIIKSSNVNSFKYVKRNSYTANKKYGDLPFALSASSNSTGTFTFRSHNTNVATISGNVVTIVGAGTALIEVLQGTGASTSGSDEFHEGNASAILIVDKASSTVAVTGNSKYAYSSNNEGPNTTTSTGSNGQISFTYSGTNKTNYAASTTRPKAVGTYKVIASIASNENFDQATSDEFNFEIIKASSKISLKGISNYTYNGSAQLNVNAIVSGSDGAITYDYIGIGSTSYAQSNTQPTNAGTYQVTATVAANENYSTATSEPFTFTIAKDNSTIFATGNKTYTYSGLAQGPNTATGVTGSTGAITYAYVGTESTVYPLSATAPSNAGTYQVVATVASDANYNQATSPSFYFTIVKAPVDLRMEGATTYTYNTNPQGPNTSNLSASNTVITYVYSGINTTNYGPSATRPTLVGTYSVKATAVEDANQFGAESDSYEFIIQKANSSISIVGNTAYTYTGLPQGPNDKALVGSSGIVSYSYSGIGSTTYTASATAPTTVGTYQVVATVVSDENYKDASSSPFNFIINKANSSISISGDASYVYSGLAQGPNASTKTGSTGIVTYSYSGNGTTKYTATSNAPTNVGTYKVTASLAADDNNNAVISDAFEFEITKATPVINISGLAVFTYNGKPQAPENATVYGSTGTVTYSYVGVGTTIYTSSSIRPKNSGEYQVIANITADNNYTATSSTPFDFSIIKAPLTVAAVSVSKTINYPNPTFFLEYSGFAPGEDENNLSALPTATTDATTSSPVGEYDIVVSGGAADNYEFTRYVNGTLTIDTRLTPEISFSNITKKYGDASFTINATSNSQGAFSYRSSNTRVATISGNTVTIVGAGALTIIANQEADVPNDFLSTNATARLVVEKAPLTITADNKTKVYGSANPIATATYNGFVNGEDETVFASNTIFTHAATVISGVGSYAIIPSGTIADDYTITFVNGRLAVTKAPLTISATEVDKVYGTVLNTATNSNKFISSGVLNDEVISAVSLIPNSAAVSASTPAGNTYILTPAAAVGTNGFDEANYEITYVPYSGTVAKAPLTIAAIDLVKVYGTSLSAKESQVNFSTVGLVNEEKVTSVNLTPNEVGLSATATAGKAYTVMPSEAKGSNGFDIANYKITYAPFNGVVSKKVITATATNKTKTYGSANPTLSITYAGFVNNEDESILSTSSTISTSALKTSDAGTYTITVTAGTADNYTITPVDGTLTINKAVLTVTAENKSITYGESKPILTFKYEGFVEGQDANVLTAVPSISTSNSSNAGVYDIIVSGGKDENYSFNYVNSSLTINKAQLSVTAQDATRCYGAVDPAISYIIVGYVNGDDESVLTSKPILTNSASSTSVAGNYKTIASGAAADNYYFTYVDGVYKVNPIPIATITSSVDYVCEGSTLVLNASEASSYLWYKDDAVITNATNSTLNVDSKGVYSVKLVNEFGCEAMSNNTLTIKQYNAPVADFTSQFYCINKPVNMTNLSTNTNSGTVKYLWDDGAGKTSTSVNPIFNYASVGVKTIKLTVTPDFCPSLKKSISKVINIEAPTPGTRLATQDLILRESVTLEGRSIANATSYAWSPSIYLSDSKIKNPIAKVEAETNFILQTTVTSGCITSDSLLVRVFNEADIFIPNLFSPNGDGYNDKLQLNFVQIPQLNYFRVFDKYNKLVFETRDKLGIWNGTYNNSGMSLPVDTYFWIVSGVDKYGRTINKSGAILLAK